MFNYRFALWVLRHLHKNEKISLNFTSFLCDDFDNFSFSFPLCIYIAVYFSSGNLLTYEKRGDLIFIFVVNLSLVGFRLRWTFSSCSDSFVEAFGILIKIFFEGSFAWDSVTILRSPYMSQS